MTISSLLGRGEKQLCDACCEDASFEALQLLITACGKDATFIRLNTACEADRETMNRYEDFIARRVSGEPLQYIIGEWDFYKYTFACGEGVLIPRPETEELTEKCISFVKNKNIANVLDLCAGTGCIGLSIALDCPFTQVTLVEKYDAALKWLNENAKKYSLKNVRVVKDDVLSPGICYGEYGLIVSNPPYIESDEILTLQQEVKREPLTALDGGADGLVFYRAIHDLWAEHLSENGIFAFECGENQTQAVASLFPEFITDTYFDIYGNPRIVTAVKQ